MRFIVLATFILFITLWVGLGLYLTGTLPITFLPESFKLLKLPTSTTELGDSLAILDGLFTSIAIVLGMIAILLQGKELKESNIAQTAQARALEIQLDYQQDSNKLGAYAARLQFLLTEADRIGKNIEILKQEADAETEQKAKSEKWKIIQNSSKLKSSYQAQAKEIDKTIKALLDT